MSLLNLNMALTPLNLIVVVDVVPRLFAPRESH